MSTLGYASKALNKIRKRISVAAEKVARSAADISLVGASKQQSAELVRTFHTAGLKNVGENYLQEALSKRKSLVDLDLNWHFIGQVQSNKTKLIAENFSWVHGVDKLKYAQRLGTQNPRATPINILLQINADEESSKGGVTFSEAASVSAQMAEIDGIKMRGFMLIPKTRHEQSAQREVFAKAKECLELSNQQYGLSMDSLSMGMSGDLEAAVMEGSTIIRIGSDLFGPRS